VIFSIAGLATFEAAKFRRALEKIQAAVTVPKEESTVLISPEMLQAVREEQEAKSVPAPFPELGRPDPPPTDVKDFTRTSEDQRGKRPDKPMFTGERDTEATSDSTPDPKAKLMPSQRGIDPRNESEMETTESRYRDGSLGEFGRRNTEPEMPPDVPTPSMPPAPDAPAPPQEAAAPPPSSIPTEGKEIAATPAPEVPEMKELLQGPNPVDVEVPKPTPEKVLPPSPPAPLEEKTATKVTPEQKPPTPKTDPQPGFRGNQRKTAIRGSISRTGRSALDVADSPLGRYQAVISRAVELEWQRNCVRHRDFITPGFLTVRFFVEPSGKVKSVQFVGDMQTGEIQKGFTLNSIRDAEIPAMPKAIRDDYKDESLELIFNFLF